MPMSNTNLNQVVSPQGMMSGLVPTRRVGQRIGMPQTVRRPFAPQGGMRGIAPISALGARPPRAGMANMAPRISGMAMGGPVDFEHVLGDSANLTQALGAFSSPMRLAKGGLAEQSLMDQIGSLLKRVHKSWHEHMLSGGLVKGYADGGAARLDPYQLRRQFRSIHL